MTREVPGSGYPPSTTSFQSHPGPASQHNCLTAVTAHPLIFAFVLHSMSEHSHSEQSSPVAPSTSPTGKNVLSMAARFEDSAASSGPMPVPQTRGRRSMSSRSLTGSVGLVSSKSNSDIAKEAFDESETPTSAASSPPAKRAPVIIPKTFSDMQKAGETTMQGRTSTKSYKSLKLSRFSEFVEQPDTETTTADQENESPSPPSHNVSNTSLSSSHNNDEAYLATPTTPANSSGHFVTRSVSSSSATAVDSSTFQSFPHNLDYDDSNDNSHDRSMSETAEPVSTLPTMHASTPSIASYSSIPSRTPSVTLRPIIPEHTELQDENVIFAVCVVGFHHIRGPEVEYWKGCDGDQSVIWPNLPFQGLPDGSHSHEENFCYFTLLYDKLNKTAPLCVPTRDRAGNIIEEASDMENATTLFGISCNRQIRTSELKDRPADVTRSSVQKSVILIARKPIFGPIREKLAVITRAFFLQADITDMTIIENLYDNLRQMFAAKIDENDMYVGMSLRELVYRLRSKVLVLLKALLLEKRIIFFSNDTELLCASQFSLVSLIPALMDYLDDCGSPLLCKYEKTVKKPTSLRSSDRKSLLAFMGLPLQPFAEGGMFNPYVPLQQFNDLKAPETKFFLIGATNSLLLSPQNKIADIVVHMDHDTVEIANNSLNHVLALSSSDKKWIDSVVQSVVSTWDPEDPWRTTGLGFHGSEDFVRQQFEDYIMGLLSSVKYDQFLSRFSSNNPPKAMRLREVDGNPIKLFNQTWVQEWRRTQNFRIFAKMTDDEIFDIVEPKHMVTVTPAFSEIQKRVAQQVGNLHLDERAAQPAREAASRVVKAWETFWWGDSAAGAAAEDSGAHDGTAEGTAKHPQSRAPRASDELQDEYLGHDNGDADDGQGSVITRKHTADDASSTATAHTASVEQTSKPPTSSGSEGLFSGWGFWGEKKDH